MCRNCGRTFPQYNTTVTICANCAINRYSKPRKPLKKRGKEYYKYEAWRKDIAIPYLDKKFGHTCASCSRADSLDVDHILNRGSHPEMKYTLTNLQWLCRSCHSLKTDRL